MRFCANVSILFIEAPFLERFGRARRAGVSRGPVRSKLGYDGYVGLEYNPTTKKTEDSFTWIPESLRGGEVRVEDVNL